MLGQHNIHRRDRRRRSRRWMLRNYKLDQSDRLWRRFSLSESKLGVRGTCPPHSPKSDKQRNNPSQRKLQRGQLVDRVWSKHVVESKEWGRWTCSSTERLSVTTCSYYTINSAQPSRRSLFKRRLKAWLWLKWRLACKPTEGQTKPEGGAIWPSWESSQNGHLKVTFLTNSTY